MLLRHEICKSESIAIQDVRQEDGYGGRYAVILVIRWLQRLTDIPAVNAACPASKLLVCWVGM
jgi:hypothetical protein